MSEFPERLRDKACERRRVFVIVPALVGLYVLYCGVLVRPARAANQGDVSAMTCSDYLKAEQASGFTEGFTGKQGIDLLSSAKASRVHDFCRSHPGAIAREAIRRSP